MRRAALLAVAALAAALAACGQERAPIPARPTLTPTVAGPPAAVATARAARDMLGREVGLPATVARVVALSPTAYDLLVALGIEPVAATSDAPPSGGGTAIGRTLSPDFHAIAALAPDLVLADARYHRGLLPDLQAFPSPVFFVDVNGYADVLAALRAVGAALGREERAAGLVEGIERQVGALRARLGGQPSPRVLVLTGMERDLYAAGPQTYVGDLLRLLGATNVAGEAPAGALLPGFAAIAPGEAARLAPDVVLVIPAGTGTLADELRADPAWAAVPAVAAGRVYALDLRRFLRAPGPSVVDALAELARLLYPSAP